MRKRFTRAFRVSFAVWTLLAVGIVAAVALVVHFDTIRTRAERDAALVLSGALRPALAQDATDLSGSGLDVFAKRADGLLSDQVRAIRLWSSEGELLASAARGAPEAVDEAALQQAAGG